MSGASKIATRTADWQWHKASPGCANKKNEVQEEVRTYYRGAIAQEKGRLAAFDFPISRGASEHLRTTAMEAQQGLSAADVIDVATLKRYRIQHEDLPTGLKEAILSLGGRLIVGLQAAASYGESLECKVSAQGKLSWRRQRHQADAQDSYSAKLAPHHAHNNVHSKSARLG